MCVEVCMADGKVKSDEMSWVKPYLIVKNVKNAMDFYAEAFGFKPGMTMPDKEGTIMHGEMTHMEQVIMMGAESPEMNSRAPKTLGGTPVSLYLYVNDVDSFFAKAKKAGATVHSEPKDQFWGDRMCHVECPEGHQWTFATKVAEFDPSKIPG